MKPSAKPFFISDDKVFFAYFLLAIPFSIFVFWLDKDSKCLSCMFDLPPGQLSMLILFLVATALMVGYITNILYNLFHLYGTRFDAFFCALVVGFAINLALLFVGLLIIWPVLLPSVIAMMVFSYFRNKRENRLSGQV